MDKNKILKIVGSIGVVGGSIALYFAGVSESSVTAVIGGVFILAGLLGVIFKK